MQHCCLISRSEELHSSALVRLTCHEEGHSGDDGNDRHGNHQPAASLESAVRPVGPIGHGRANLEGRRAETTTRVGTG